MENRPYTGFYASFLGGFSLTYGGEEIVMYKRLSQKSMQLFLLLLKAERQGISWKKLAEMVSGRSEDHRKQHNNLRQQMRTLRNLMKHLPGLPEGKLVVGTSRGIYYFSLDYPVETDTGRIDRLYQKMRDVTGGDERKEILQEICRLYTGEFLPALLGEEWAIVEGARYQSIYFSCVQELCGIFEKEEAYPELLALCNEAGRIYPYSQWNQMQIKYLIRQRRYEESVKAFEKTAEDLEDLYEGLGRHPLELTSSQEESRLPNGGRGQPYYCSYPSFVDIYRVISRIIERSQSQAALLLCIIAGEEPMVRGMERLKARLDQVLRSSDIYTRYSANQFVALLPETGAEDGRKVVERLRRSQMPEETLEVDVTFDLSYV